MSGTRGRTFRETIAVVTAAAFCASLGAPAFAQQPPAPEKPQPSALRISHDPLVCVTTELAPEVDAAVQPGRSFDRGFVYFKATGTEDFYYTPMKGYPGTLAGVLPRPLSTTHAVDYYVRAIDLEQFSRRTADYEPPVVKGNACQVKGVPVGRDGAKVTVGLTRKGQYPIPPGFNKKDIAFVVLTTGAVVGLALALKGAGSAAAAAGVAGGTSGGAAGTAGSAAGGASTAGSTAAGTAGGATGGASTAGGATSGASAAGGATGGATAGASSAAGGAAAGGVAASGGVSTAVLVGGGVALVGGGVAIASSNKGSGSNTPTPSPTAQPTATPTPTRTPTPAAGALRFVEAEVSWSGLGDVDLQILDPTNQSVGQTFPVGCESTGNRTERVLLQGRITAGTFRVVLTGKPCGTGSPTSISAVVTVQSDVGPKCASAFVNVPVGGTITACSFTAP